MRFSKLNQKNRQRGAILPILVVFFPTILLAIMLTLDGYVLVEADLQLHNASEAAAEGGLCHFLERGDNPVETLNRVRSILRRVYLTTKGQTDFTNVNWESNGTQGQVEMGTYNTSSGNFVPRSVPFLDSSQPNASINALRLTVFSNTSTMMTGFLTSLIGIDTISISDQVISYKVDASSDPDDNLFDYRYVHP